MRVRDICAGLIAYLTAQRVFKSYADSGRYVENASAAARFPMDGGARMLLHYGSCQGALYQDLIQWQRLYRLIGSFTAAGVAAPGHRPWRLPSVYGSLGSTPPPDILTHLESSLSGLGLAKADRNDPRSTIVFRMQESATVMDLPEPYGKWFQHQEKRARWQEPTDLSFTMEARVVSRLGGPATGPQASYSAQLDVEMTAPAVNLLTQIYPRLISALQMERTALSEADLRRDLLSKIEQRLSTL